MHAIELAYTAACNRIMEKSSNTVGAATRKGFYEQNAELQSTADGLMKGMLLASEGVGKMLKQSK
jgi:hypothetical protein